MRVAATSTSATSTAISGSPSRMRSGSNRASGEPVSLAIETHVRHVTPWRTAETETRATRPCQRHDPPSKGEPNDEDTARDDDGRGRPRRDWYCDAGQPDRGA